MMGDLYLVPTPIGNLEDITLRALRVLREVDLIAAEDTRVTGRLLAHFEIATPLTSYHEHSKLTKLDTILEALEAGDVALVSDAGTPGLSDPGYELIQAALARSVQVIPLPGPSALLPALVASGLPTDRFLYLGFLPRRRAARRSAIEAVREVPHTLALFEAPHRLLDTLSDLGEILGERQVSVARELTKLHEEVWRGTLGAALAHFGEHPPRGEITLVVAGTSPADAARWTEAEVRAALAERLAQGESPSAAARTVAKASGWPRKTVYHLALNDR
jgi:16S rRNA (cytidine1402-2'-O)-methyltransferase